MTITESILPVICLEYGIMRAPTAVPLVLLMHNSPVAVANLIWVVWRLSIIWGLVVHLQPFPNYHRVQQIVRRPSTML